LGRLPQVDDEVSVEGGMLKVMRMDGRRIERIRFTPTRVTSEVHDV
jgi:CBS domain containing-hemolysin-like protein